jgi:UDP-N-acetylmuramoyl-tripeptide--D-alanyl-D-alanine ligase
VIPPDGAAAVDVLANLLRPGDVVLVKASRSAHLEGVAAELLSADQLRADDPKEADR